MNNKITGKSSWAYAFTVASMWKTTYPRRTALREELKKVGNTTEAKDGNSSD